MLVFKGGKGLRIQVSDVVLVPMKWLTILFPLLLPIAVQWVKWHERRILREGQPLSVAGLADALKMGVREPHRIRVMAVERIPLLNGRALRWLSRWVPEISAHTVGLSLRYGIYVRSKYGSDRHLLAHECVHCGQYERHGGNIGKFLHAYFSECIEWGYASSPMEQEAILKSSRLDDG